MRAYIIRRLFSIIPTLFVATLIVFLLIRLIPGDIIDQMVKEHEYVSDVSRQMTRDTIERTLGLDVPIYVQYGRWLSGIFTHGSLGVSLWSKMEVTEEVLQRLPVTIELGFLAIMVALVISLPIGIYSAIRQDTIGDYASRSVAILFVAIPNFWLATMVMVFPPLWWNWSPPMQLIRFTEDPLGNLGMFIVPALVLGAAMSGVTMRMTRTMMLEVLRQDYIRTAWSKGLRERVVVSRHVMKNALMPVVTILGLQLPVMIGGAVIIEQIFVLPGVGRLMLNAVNTRDYPIVSGVMIMVASGVLLINLAVDLSYSLLDPRIRYR
jgi:peptide/nickel transport system permease protein